jgi:copper ion binding protein
VIQNIELSVPAMSCDNCVNNIRSTLGAVAGVAVVTPDLAKKRVAVRFDEAKVTERQIATALAKLGFSSARA